MGFVDYFTGELIAVINLIVAHIVIGNNAVVVLVVTVLSER